MEVCRELVEKGFGAAMQRLYRTRTFFTLNVGSVTTVKRWLVIAASLLIRRDWQNTHV
jgi:hypothetical protein